MHSRIEAFAEEVRRLVPAGNVYVNRSIIGAVVGVQPFGGEGLSGTGPKAGGPHALLRYALERAVQRQHHRPGRRPGAAEPLTGRLTDPSPLARGMGVGSRLPSGSQPLVTPPILRH